MCFSLIYYLNTYLLKFLLSYVLLRYYNTTYQSYLRLRKVFKRKMSSFIKLLIKFEWWTCFKNCNLKFSLNLFKPNYIKCNFVIQFIDRKKYFIFFIYFEYWFEFRFSFLRPTCSFVKLDIFFFVFVLII